MGVFQHKQVTNRETQSWFCRTNQPSIVQLSHSTKKFVFESIKFSLSNSKNETFILNSFH